MQRKYRGDVYITGDYIDGNFYPVYRKGGRRKERFRPTSEMQQRLNDKYSEERLRRLLHLNFSKKDIEIHLTYSENNLPDSPDAAKKDVQNFLRRAKRLYKKAGIELKYIWVTEKGVKSERLHHHITMSGGISRDELEELWEYGHANTKALRFTKDGLKGLSHYITKQPLYFRRFNCSKNLIKPQPHTPKVSLSHRLMDELFDRESARKFFEDLYPGYKFQEYMPVSNDVNGGLYLSFFMYKAELEHGKHRPFTRRQKLEEQGKG